MKNQLLFLIVCCGLIMPGSGLLKNLNAQTRNSKKSSISLRQSGKTPSPEKQKSVQKIVRQRKAVSKSGNIIGDDPCLTSVPITVGQTINAALSNGDCQLQDGSYIDFYSFNAGLQFSDNFLPHG